MSRHDWLAMRLGYSVSVGGSTVSTSDAHPHTHYGRRTFPSLLITSIYRFDHIYYLLVWIVLSETHDSSIQITLYRRLDCAAITIDSNLNIDTHEFEFSRLESLSLRFGTSFVTLENILLIIVVCVDISSGILT